jgi:hypothetical protein
MFKSKFLIDSTWKDILAKNKAVKDNGLLKQLAEIKKLGDDDHDDAQKVLDEVLKLTAQLKKSKEIAAVPAVAKHLAELTSAAEAAVRETAKAKAEAEKTQKAKAEAEKKAQAAKKDDDEDEGDDDGSPALLTTKMLPLLRLVLKGEMMHALVAKSGKQVAVMLSRKPIPPARRKMLADQLGGGSTKYYPGHCCLEAGAPIFVLKAEVAGLSKLVKMALLEQTGLRVNKVKCRGEDGEDDDGDGAFDDGGAPPVRDEGDEEQGERDTGVAELGTAPEVWLGTRDLLESRIDALKKAVRAQLDGEDADFAKVVDGHLAKIDRIVGRLDRRLTDSLIKAREAGTADDRASELDVSRAILGEYIRYVRSEPLIEHLDENPFGVKTELKATLVNSLTQLAKAIG